MSATEVRFQDALSGEGRRREETDQVRVNVGLVSAAVLAALTVATASPERAASSGGCGRGAVGAGSYAYAGYQAASSAHGVRATITALSIPNVGAGHVAAWIGVGGPGSAPGGTDSWLQAGVAALPGEQPFVYTEVVHPDRPPELRTIASNVVGGSSSPPRRAGDQTEAGLVARLG